MIDVGDSIGDISAIDLSGNTIVFDSFSSETDVQARNRVVNSVSTCNDASKHFATNFNVRFSGNVAAVLSPSTVSSYRVVDARGASGTLLPADKRPLHVRAAAEQRKRKHEESAMSPKRQPVAQRTYPEDKSIQNLQHEIEIQKQRTARLLDDSVPLSIIRNEFSQLPPQMPVRPPIHIAPMISPRYSSISEACAALNRSGVIQTRHPFPAGLQRLPPLGVPSFASTLLCAEKPRPYDISGLLSNSNLSPGTSSETLVYTMPANLLTSPVESLHGSSEEVVVSSLHTLGVS